MPGGTRSYNKEVCHSKPLVSLFLRNFELMSQFTKGHAQDLLQLAISNQYTHKKLSDFGKKSSTIILSLFMLKESNQKISCQKPDFRLELAQY